MDASHNSENLSMDESSMTMVDYLETQEAMQDDAAIILGNDDEKCTYDKVRPVV